MSSDVSSNAMRHISEAYEDQNGARTIGVLQTRWVPTQMQILQLLNLRPCSAGPPEVAVMSEAGAANWRRGLVSLSSQMSIDEPVRGWAGIDQLTVQSVL